MECVNINTNRITIKIFLIFLFASCVNNSGKVLYEYPSNLKIKSNTFSDFYLKIENRKKLPFIIEKINSSCNCIVVEDDLPIIIRQNARDSIKVRVFANNEDGGTETIVLVHNLDDRFKILEVSYETF